MASDTFASATLISGLVATDTGNNTGYGVELGEDDFANGGGVNAQNTGWTKWVAPVSGNVVVTTAGSSFDTQLGVFTGAAVNATTYITGADADTLPGSNESVQFTATAGTTYYFQVDGFLGATGDYNLTVVAKGLVEFNSSSSSSAEAVSGGPFVTVLGEVAGSAASERWCLVSAERRQRSGLHDERHSSDGEDRDSCRGIYYPTKFDLSSFGGPALKITNDNSVESNEFVSLSFSSIGTAFITTAQDANLDSLVTGSTSHTILDDDFATLSFSGASTSISEGAGVANVAVKLGVTPSIGGTGPLRSRFQCRPT